MGANPTTFKTALCSARPHTTGQTSHPSSVAPRPDFLGLETVVAEHKDPLFPKSDGTTPLPEERSSVSSPAPSCKRSLQLGDVPEPARTLPATRSGICRSWASAACGPAVCVGRAPAERKWLRPDIALFVFPVKKKEHFAYFFGIRQIFLIPLVSCRLQVFPPVSLSGQRHDIISLSLTLPKSVPAPTCVCHFKFLGTR